MSLNLWTDNRTSALRNLWQEGCTARQIAERIGGVSRNAVIGKIYRLGLSQKRVRSARIPLSPVSKNDTEYDTCQWPFGYPGREDFHFCGASVVAERPYCANHCALAYRQNPQQASDAA